MPALCRSRPALIGFIEPVRGPWMEPLEARVLLSASDGDAVRPGYFKYWGGGAVSADAQPDDIGRVGQVLDVDAPTFDRTLATFKGAMPKVDRAYVKLSDKWRPLELVDVPGPTFEARVGTKVKKAALVGQSSFAFINDHGSDYFAPGPKLLSGSGTLLVVEDGSTLPVDNWGYARLDLPTLYDRTPMPDTQFRVGLDWHDGAAASWQTLPYNGGQVVESLRGLDLERDFHGVSRLTVVIERTDSDRARVTFDVAVDTSGLPDTDAGVPNAPTIVPPRELELPYVHSSGQARTISIDQPIVDLGTFSTLKRIPTGTTASLDWDDGTTQQTRVVPLSTEPNATTGRWEYSFPIDAHRIGTGHHQVYVTLAYGEESVTATEFFFGVDDQMTPVNRGGEIGAIEGDREVGLDFFVDRASHSPDSYKATVELEDGRTFPAQVVADFSDNGFAWNQIVAKLPLWNPAGSPVVDYGLDAPKIAGQVILTRGTDALVLPVTISLLPANWIAPFELSIDGQYSLPKMLEVNDIEPFHIFADRRGEVTIEVKTAYDIDPANLDVTLTWDKRHQTRGQAVRTSSGNYVIRAAHKYPRAGSYQFSATVGYGDATETLSRRIVSADRSPDPAADGLLVSDNPVVANAAAGIDWGREDVWFGSVAFVDALRPAARHDHYAATIVFDDGSPARASIEEDYTFDGDKTPATRVFFSAYFAEPGIRAFTVTIRVDDGRTLKVRGVADVMPQEGARHGLRGGGNGLIWGADGEPLKPVATPSTPPSRSVPDRVISESMPLATIAGALELSPSSIEPPAARAPAWSTLEGDRAWLELAGILRREDMRGKRALVSF